ncbi:oligosaccharide flippase family protein [Enterococcus bulliens]
MNENTKYKKLAINSLLFALGNFGSKLITFVMLPVYTKYLTQSAYGISDLVISTVALLLPIISLSIFDSVLRFGMDKKLDKKLIFNTGFRITLIGIIISFACLPLAYIFHIHYLFYIFSILVANVVQSLFSQYAKANNNIKLFALNGMLLSFLTAFLNIIFLAIFKLGITGFLLSTLIAILISDIFLFFKLKLFNIINLKIYDKNLSRKMLRFSVPLIPNSIALWINNIASRYFILWILGTAANGIFAVANKIPMLIGVLNTIFFQAWQMSAIEEYDSDDKVNFYSNTFDMYYKILFIGSSILLLFLKPIMNIIVDQAFYDSWKYVPLLILAVLYSSFSGFLGQYYVAAMETRAVFTTTIIGAVINVCLNFVLIPEFGLYGAGLSSAISFFILWIIRVFDTRKYIRTNYNIINIIFNNILLIMQISLLYVKPIHFLFIYNYLIFFIILFLNKSIYKELTKKIFNCFKKGNHK